MSSAALIRLAGLAAGLAGVLRTGAAIAPYAEPGVGLELFYLVIDVLILLGLLGVYAYEHERVGILGLAGFLLALVGTASITGPDGSLGGVDVYLAGAGAISIGLLLLALASWNAERLPRWVCVLWALSTLVGVGGAVIGAPAATFRVAGVAFGLGFVGAGLRLWSDPAGRAA